MLLENDKNQSNKESKCLRIKCNKGISNIIKVFYKLTLVIKESWKKVSSIFKKNYCAHNNYTCISVMTTLGGIGRIMYMAMLMYLVLVE